MPDNNTTTPTPTDNTSAPSAPTSNVVVEPVAPVAPAAAPAANPVDDSVINNPAASNVPANNPIVPVDAPAPAGDPTTGEGGIISEVVRRINEANNVLVALSSDPTVDEMSAAIGLSLFLDKLGKRATAIYSGSTPNALEFLKPEETFEPTVDSLQDFVIALNKEKADHLRYKLDGDFVKIYITPYRTKIAEDDLDFSYGDFNVDLVLALNVANGVDLDAALREHGRIMHDASIIDITTGNPGKLGEIEWSDKAASSVSEMIAKLLYSISSKVEIGAPEATAFLTGIVAATNRFSNTKTTPDTMQIASRLMESGANQQLISKNITPDVENEMYSLASSDDKKPVKKESDPTKLDIEHDPTIRTPKKDKKSSEEDAKEEEPKEELKEEPVTELKDEVKEEESQEEESKEEPQNESAEKTLQEASEDNKEDALFDDLQAAAASLSQAGAEATPEQNDSPLEIDSSKAEEPTINNETTPASAFESAAPTLPPVVDEGASETNIDAPAEPVSEPENNPAIEAERPEKVIEPPAEMADLSSNVEESNKYGQMLEAALDGANPALDTMATPQPEETAPSNPAASGAPAVPANPEINGVPEINYMPMPGEEVLPPPPTPPIDMDSSMPTTEPAPAPEPAAPVEPIAPAAPVAEPTPTSLGAQPAMQDQVYAPQAADPGAFKIPGM